MNVKPSAYAKPMSRSTTAPRDPAAVATPRPEGPAETLDPEVAIRPVASLQEVLAALSDPVRLEMVRRLMAAGRPQACGTLYASVGKSTASHHFKLLRENGVIERHLIGGQVHQYLRQEALDAAHPGVVRTIVAAAEAERGA